MPDVDIVTVYHRDENRRQALALIDVIEQHEPNDRWTYSAVDNRTCNRGFAGGCNFGAKSGKAPFILFLNPDVEVHGPFIHTLVEALQDVDTVIAGERFAKPVEETDHWGCPAWVCGACFGVDRKWFESVGGFYEGYCFGWEETDLIRRAMHQERRIVELELPITHASPSPVDDPDRAYKEDHMMHGKALFMQRWNGRRHPR